MADGRWPSADGRWPGKRGNSADGAAWVLIKSRHFENFKSGNLHMKKMNFQKWAVIGCFLFSAFGIMAQSEDAKLESVFRAYLDDNFKLRPLEATRLGDHRFDSRIEDVTPEARRQWLEATRKALAELPKKVDYQKLSR